MSRLDELLATMRTERAALAERIAADVLELARFDAAIGALEGTPTAPATPAAVFTAPSAPALVGEAHECPECEFVGKSGISLGVHRRRSHGVSGASTSARNRADRGITRAKPAPAPAPVAVPTPPRPAPVAVAGDPLRRGPQPPAVYRPDAHQCAVCTATFAFKADLARHRSEEGHYAEEATA
jgi:hypothetical protein